MFCSGTPVLRHLAQDCTKLVKRQGDKYSYHLGKIKLRSQIEELALRKVKKQVRKTTIIAYDLTDISKEGAQKIEKLSTVYDDSRKKPTTSFELHGVGINNIHIKLQIYDASSDTLNRTRLNIIQEISNNLSK